MAKCPALWKAARLYARRSRLNSTSGGSSETELKELAVMPIMPASCEAVVTTVMPVAKLPRAWRNSRGSMLTVVVGPMGAERELAHRRIGFACLAASRLRREQVDAVGGRGAAGAALRCYSWPCCGLLPRGGNGRRGRGCCV